MEEKLDAILEKLNKLETKIVGIEKQAKMLEKKLNKSYVIDPKSAASPQSAPLQAPEAQKTESLVMSDAEFWKDEAPAKKTVRAYGKLSNKDKPLAKTPLSFYDSTFALVKKSQTDSLGNWFVFLPKGQYVMEWQVAGEKAIQTKQINIKIETGQFEVK